MALRRGFATKVQWGLRPFAVGIASFCSGDCVLLQWGLRPFQKAQKCASTRITTSFPRPLQKPLDTVDEVGIVATRRPLRLLLIPNGAASPLDTVAEKKEEEQ